MPIQRIRSTVKAIRRSSGRSYLAPLSFNVKLYKGHRLCENYLLKIFVVNGDSNCFCFEYKVDNAIKYPGNF